MHREGSVPPEVLKQRVSMTSRIITEPEVIVKSFTRNDARMYKAGSPHDSANLAHLPPPGFYVNMSMFPTRSRQIRTYGV
jgi:hypothetical protein